MQIWEGFVACCSWRTRNNFRMAPMEDAESWCQCLFDDDGLARRDTRVDKASTVLVRDR